MSEEKEYFMEPLILKPTPTAQWHSLINDAERELSITLGEDLESYLVFLLMRFAKEPEILQSVLALDFLSNLEYKHERDSTRDNNLRDVGDKCLLLTGLFPGRARRRRVRISYYVKLGQMAYSSISELRHIQLHSNDNPKHNPNLGNQDIFCHLCQHFVGLMDVLQAMRELSGEEKRKESIDLIQAEELWSDTKSQHALKILREHTTGFILQNGPPSNTKH